MKKIGIPLAAILLSACSGNHSKYDLLILKKENTKGLYVKDIVILKESEQPGNVTRIHFKACDQTGKTLMDSINVGKTGDGIMVEM